MCSRGNRRDCYLIYCFFHCICPVQALQIKINAPFLTNLYSFECLGGCFCLTLQSPDNSWTILDGREGPQVDQEIYVFPSRCIAATAVESWRVLVLEFAAGGMIGIWAHSYGIHHELQETSPNGVSVQSSPTPDSYGIGWQSLIHIYFTSSPPHGNDQLRLSESKLCRANNGRYRFDRRRAKSNALTIRKCVQRSTMYIWYSIM